MDQTSSKHNFFRIATLVTVISLACGSAFAQWQWVDGSGRKVFSDTPPPAGTPDKNVLKRPGPARAAAASASPVASTPATSATTATAAPKASGRDESLEGKKKQADEAEKAKKKAEADKMAKSRSENCDRARSAKATLDSGIRIATTNSKGEREIMDDKARSGEAKRIDDIIRTDCGPMPQTAQ